MAKIGALHRVTNSSGGHVEMYPITSVSAIPDFEITVAARLAANTIFKTAAQFTSQNPTLLAGQFGQETDTKLVKLGDGTTAWNSLAYLSGNITFKTAAEWSTSNPVLNNGSIGQETNTGQIKIGDGVTAWNSLVYVTAPSTISNIVRKTAAEWVTAGTTVLGANQLGVETDTGYAKIGNGTATYANLEYVKSPVNPDNIIRKTAAAWVTAGSTVLLEGQVGYETDTKYAKIGDGSTTYANLEYVKSPVNPDNVLIKTAAQWTSANPTLLAGQIGIESDTEYVKFGDGSTAWNSLSYAKSPVNPDNIIRKTAAQWSSASSTVLLDGQIGYETDSHYMKIGDGSTTYANLSYVMTPTTTVELKSGSSTTTNDTITLTIS